jgi:prolyl-tRNA synthetase
VHVVATGKGDQVEDALALSGELEAAGLRVLVDDRAGVSPGVKFTDAELLGIPTIVVVGRRLGEGIVEVRERRTGERTDVPLTDVVGRLGTSAAR